MATTIVLYPKGVNFDMDYYLAKHMPLVYEIWSPMGLKSWKIVEFHDQPEGPYKVMAVLEWKDHDSWKIARTKPESNPIFDDIPVFSDKAPTLLSGPVVGISS